MRAKVDNDDAITAAAYAVLRVLHDQRKLTLTAIAESIGANERTVRRWYRSETKPYPEAARRLLELGERNGITIADTIAHDTLGGG